MLVINCVNIYDALFVFHMLSSCCFISFDFCAPPKDEMWKNSPTENLGQVVFGERIRPSIYKVIAATIYQLLTEIFTAIILTLCTVFQWFLFSRFILSLNDI